LFLIKWLALASFNKSQTKFLRPTKYVNIELILGNCIHAANAPMNRFGHVAASGKPFAAVAQD
jgi:hypothetical protein